MTSLDILIFEIQTSESPSNNESNKYLDRLRNQRYLMFCFFSTTFSIFVQTAYDLRRRNYRAPTIYGDNISEKGIWNDDELTVFLPFGSASIIFI